MMAKINADKELNNLKRLIYESKPTIRADYVVGFYRYWAKIDALEKLLLKKKLISKKELYRELLPIYKTMKKDFIFKKHSD